LTGSTEKSLRLTEKNSRKIMGFVDRLQPAMRELVYEFGVSIVAEMVSEGHRDASTLRPILEGWRARRQQQAIGDARTA
jgi:hypothetical protein